MNIATSAFMERGEPAGAMKAAGELFALHLTTDDQAGQVDALLLSSNIHLQSMDFAKASSVAKDALGIAKESGDKKLQIKALGVLQSLSLAENQGEDKAIQLGTEMLALAREAGDLMQEASTLFVLGKINAQKTSNLAKSGRTDVNYVESISQCQDALEILQDVDNQRAQLPVLEFIYSMHRAQSQTLEAMDAARDIVSIMQDLGNPGGQAGALIMVAEGDPSTFEALQSAEQAFAIFEGFGNTFGKAVSKHLQFKAHYAQESRTQAYQCAEQAKALFKEVGDVHGQAVCGNAMANILLKNVSDSKIVGIEIAKQCMETTKLAREALDNFAAIGDSHGRLLSMNIITTMKKLNAEKGTPNPWKKEADPAGDEE